MTLRGLLALSLILTAPFAAQAAQAAQPAKPGQAASSAPAAPALPTRLACTPDPGHRVALSLDAQGVPLGASVAVAAGARECDLTTSGAPVLQADGRWRFAWRDERLGSEQLLIVQRGPAHYRIALQPAACGALQLPAFFVLAAQAPGCSVTVDRQAAFAQFWQALREALARDDGAALQGLSLPRLSFVEGPDEVTAPASVMRQAARCVPGVPAPVQRLSLGSLLQAAEAPRLDMPPLHLRQNREISVAGAMTLAWTPQGWRIQGFNASPSVMRDCQRGR
ncbi:hypothetical protein [Aquabacterium sp. OR-4]|uniref:hypothetical protein n=1 Tax=Aquabacterium sp. OR-4 TaxID=2978127 RepID=UPI0028C5BDB8|nr:hypothetical protein [Aquabacterium sp. OR-4]MDT7838665.1 hypothetical protein [Aquabacterium sp. OR-4]